QPDEALVSTLTPPQRSQLYEYSLERVPHERSHQHHHRCHRRKERGNRNPFISSEKQRFYSCDRYGSRDSGHPRHSDHSRAPSPSGPQDPSTQRQGSGSASGSPRLTSSGASTPCRGIRRQLPQTPLTPRPSVTYRQLTRPRSTSGDLLFPRASSRVYQSTTPYYTATP
ncbi:hypothetical protein GDO86_020260, partial [Hymenochirus boettgeri]